MARSNTKTAAVTIGVGLATWGFQMVVSGEYIVGGAGVLIGLALVRGYQFIEDSDHSQVYNDVVAAIGPENFQELSQMSGRELRQLREEFEQQ